ncbi:disulfide bond formation protein B [Pradoshia eiseniae]|uniref:Probable disulfide formation protein n=1 Tax=Pradoshia eiseniae TaxID=2064768 RepID=A0A2S7MWV6_9BACI|nr:disulfide oxidoreductase [Pradoshia eiseniae]PQD94249.1 disulfide bond formation protein B [Pradoshia eiseniae]
MKKIINRENALFLAFAAGLIATLGSLYFSEIKGYEPCSLCWYQRILMYPFTIILAIAIIKKDYEIAIYSTVLSLIGACISTYHVLIQKVPFFTDKAASCGRIPCTGDYINWFGFITIPMLALIAFVIILVCSIYVLKTNKGESK